ncbi:RNB domain-containing ribonuclease [Saxibacter everestensis]|uniref:RNB domain-containing ribonuclease n=1 Tax=Saxibacter everestensis TaxID=2909229 RepID=A0ABY8QZ24_9MICO|nr:RNB domain-containing ribonuclease [Brevibacteriaceae bacterium ZFBP1038]
MILHKVVLPGATPERFAGAYTKIRKDADLPDSFPPDVLSEAEQVAAEDFSADRQDLTQIPFVTIDPPGSTDLDQAMYLERRGSGFRVHYAIADLPFFIEPGGLVDLEARRRGQTIYLPDGRVPLHPQVISENAASLLAGELRPALVWIIDLDEAGHATGTDLVSAQIRSVAQLDYESVQADADAGTLHESIDSLLEIGVLRRAQEEERGGADLRIPDQEVSAADGGFELQFRPRLPVEDANAQISLLAGMCAAQIMLDGKVGLLRTLPGPDQSAVDDFFTAARSLGVPANGSYQNLLRSLDESNPAHLALLYRSPGLFRGAGYTAFNGSVPEENMQAAVGAPYAHVTAPIRRLVDRFGLAICHGLLSGQGAPQWALEALDSLPGLMEESDRKTGLVERSVIAVTEALVLEERVGETFDAVVVGRDVKREKNPLQIQLTSPAVLSRADGTEEPGENVKARLEDVDVSAPSLRFTVSGSAAGVDS